MVWNKVRKSKNVWEYHFKGLSFLVLEMQSLNIFEKSNNMIISSLSALLQDKEPLRAWTSPCAQNGYIKGT